MIFAHDTEAALVSAAALVNTIGRHGDLLVALADLDDFLEVHRWTGRFERSEAELRSVRAQRRLWEADEEEIAASVNRLLRESHALPQLVRHDGWPFHLHATPADAPLATRMAVEAAMAFVDVVRDRELSRLGFCALDDCDNVVIDLSKNRSKRFCDGGCGNRSAVSAYRARQAAKTR